MSKTPFKFLDSYTQEDKDIFFGRENEIEELYYRIFDGNLLIVYGSSGTGKTSLIQCGLARKFQEADWMPLLVRRGNDINEAVNKSLQQAAITPLKPKNNLVQNIKSVYLDYFKPIYFLFDQFEELFIFGSDAEIEEFTNNIKSCLDTDLSCKFIFVLRGEYLEHVARFEEKIPEFFKNRVRIERMTRKNAMLAIEEPCKVFNIRTSDDFAAKVLEKLGNEKSSVELTYLQVYLDKLYKKAILQNSRNPEFTSALVQESGRIDDVLAEFLDEQIAKTAEPEVALTILKSFVSNEGTKKQMTIGAVVDFALTMGKKIGKDVVEKYIRQFVDLRILKDKDDNDNYELRHDALAAKIYDKISFNEKQLLEIRQFVLNRYNDYKRRGNYLEEQDIQYILPYENKMFLNAEQKEFVEKSIKAAKKKRQQRRTIFIGSSIALISVLAGFSVYSMVQRNQAVAQSEIAQQKTKEALLQKDLAEKAKEMSLKASRQAMDAKTYAELQAHIASEQKLVAEDEAKKAEEQKHLATEQTELATQQKGVAEQQKAHAIAAQNEAERLRLISLGQNLAFKSLQIKSDPQAAALLASEGYQLAKNNNGNVQDPQIYSALQQGLKNFGNAGYPAMIHTGGDVKAIAAAGDGKLFAITGTGKLLGYNKGDVKATTTAALGSGIINTAYTDDEGKYGVTAYDNNTVKIWNLATREATAALSGHTGLVRAAAFGHSGNMVVTGGRDSTAIIWNNAKIAKEVKFPSRIRTLAVSPDETMIVAGCENGAVYKYHIRSNDMGTLANNPQARVQCVSYSGNGQYIIATWSNGQLNIMNMEGHVVKAISEGSSVDYLATNGADMLAEATANHMVRVYDLNNLSQKPIEINDAGGPVKGLALSRNGILSVACANNTIRNYFVHSSAVVELLGNKILRNLTAEEWNAYIGKEVPYHKIKENI